MKQKLLIVEPSEVIVAGLKAIMEGQIRFKLLESEVGTDQLEERIIAYLSEIKGIPLEDAMDAYYRSRLATQIANGLYGIENLDYKYLVEDLVENEPELFAK